MTESCERDYIYYILLVAKIYMYIYYILLVAKIYMYIYNINNLITLLVVFPYE